MHDFEGITTQIFTPACLDALGLGALLALASSRLSTGSVDKFLRYFALPVGLASALAFMFLLKGDAWTGLNVIFYDVSIALFFCWLVNGAAKGFRGPVGQLLSSRPLTYCGRISYGIYVYHPFMPKLCKYIFAMLGTPYPENPATAFVVLTVATLLISSLSWYLLEKPINDLKRFFTYKPPAPWDVVPEAV